MVIPIHALTPTHRPLAQDQRYHTSSAGFGNFGSMGKLTIHLFGADMMKAERILAFIITLLLVVTHSTQKSVGAYNVGFDKLSSAFDGLVQVALSRKMPHCMR